MRLFLCLFIIIFATIVVKADDREKLIAKHLTPLSAEDSIEIDSEPSTGSGLMGSMPSNSIYQMCRFINKKYIAEKNDDEIWQKLINSEKYTKDLILFYFLFVSENLNDTRLSEIKVVTKEGLEIVNSFLSTELKISKKRIELIKRYLIISNSQKFTDDLVFQFNFVVQNFIQSDSDFVLYELFSTSEYISLGSYYYFVLYSKFKKKVSFDDLSKVKRFSLEIMLKKLKSIKLNKTEIEDCFKLNYIIDYFNIKEKVKEVPTSELFNLVKPLEPDFVKMFSLEMQDKELVYCHENYLIGIACNNHVGISADQIVSIALKTIDSSIFSSCINLLKNHYEELSEENIKKLRVKNLDSIKWSERLGDKKLYFTSLIDQLEKAYKNKKEDKK